MTSAQPRASNFNNPGGGLVSFLRGLTADPIRKAVHEEFAKEIPITKLSASVKEFYSVSEGYVYLIHAEGTNRYKVGRTKSISRRIRELKSQSPYPLKLVDCYWSPDADSDEKWFHTLYGHWKVHGEWFDFDFLTDFRVTNFQETRYTPIPLTTRTVIFFCEKSGCRGRRRWFPCKCHKFSKREGCVFFFNTGIYK